MIGTPAGRRPAWALPTADRIVALAWGSRQPPHHPRGQSSRRRPHPGASGSGASGDFERVPALRLFCA